jgi:ankyrin repeat protein
MGTSLFSVMPDLEDCIELYCEYPICVLQEKNGEYPIHFAAKNGYKECLSFLINIGADKDIRTLEAKFTPVILCVLNDRLACLELLLQNGADPDIKDSTDHSALHYAIYKNSPTAVQCILSASKIKPNIDILNDDSKTPLHLAAIYGHADCLELLLKNGANIHAQTYMDEHTPLHLAAVYGNKKCVALLLKFGLFWPQGENHSIIIDSEDMEGKTPLHYTAITGQRRCMKLLLQAGANINYKDRAGNTPLAFLTQRRFESRVRILMDRYEYLGERRLDLPLFNFSIWSGCSKCIKLLLQKGANPFSVTSNNVEVLRWKKKFSIIYLCYIYKNERSRIYDHAIWRKVYRYVI